MADFDEARQATIDMFNNPDEEAQEPQEEQTPPVEEQPVQPEQSMQNDEQAQINEAANIAEAATNAAVQSNQHAEAFQQQLQQTMFENEQLRKTNEELQNTITQQSQIRQEEIIEDAMQDEMPTLDVNALAFEDEATIQQMQQDYANKMRDYVTKSVQKEFAPALEYAKQGMAERERAEVINALKGVPELNGIENMLPQLDRIIGNNPTLSSDNVPMDEKYIMAYAIARGVNAINTPPPQPPSDPTAEQLMEFYRNNPEFQQMVDRDRLEAIKNSQQVPAMSASNGAVNAALNIQEKPKTWEDASERTRKMFREDD